MDTNRKIGTLILVEIDREPVDGDIVKTKDYGVWRFKKAPCPMPFWGNPNECKVIQPIIICDDEINKDGDAVYSNGYHYPGVDGDEKGPGFGSFTVPKFIGTAKKYGNAPLRVRGTDIFGKDYLYDIRPEYTFKKILVSTNEFSQETLQAIIYGEVKDGDKVEVEMESYYSESDVFQFMQQNSVSNGHAISEVSKIKVKLHTDGTAIIHLYSNNLEGAALKYAEDNYSDGPPSFEEIQSIFKAGAKWHENKMKNQTSN